MKERMMLVLGLTMLVGLLGAQSMFGAFQINTEPQGAMITISGTNQCIGTTPSQAIPIIMDQSMVYNCGIPGREFSITITKEGYYPIQQDIFVPYNKSYQQDALRNPTTFNFYLTEIRTQPQTYYYQAPPRHRDFDWFDFFFPPRHYHHGHCYPPPPPPPNHGGHGHGHGDNHQDWDNDDDNPPPPPGGHGGHGHH
jgi:hypothetical protein